MPPDDGYGRRAQKHKRVTRLLLDVFSGLALSGAASLLRRPAVPGFGVPWRVLRHSRLGVATRPVPVAARPGPRHVPNWAAPAPLGNAPGAIRRSKKSRVTSAAPGFIKGQVWEARGTKSRQKH